MKLGGGVPSGAAKAAPSPIKKRGFEIGLSASKSEVPPIFEGGMGYYF